MLLISGKTLILLPESNNSIKFSCSSVGVSASQSSTTSRAKAAEKDGFSTKLLKSLFNAINSKFSRNFPQRGSCWFSFAISNIALAYGLAMVFLSDM